MDGNIFGFMSSFRQRVFLWFNEKKIHIKKKNENEESPLFIIECNETWINEHTTKIDDNFLLTSSDIRTKVHL